MHWYHLLAWFFGGAFLANSIPHIGTAVAGRPFQTPFAKPHGKGLSSSVVNILWGFFNLAISYLLLFHVGAFDLHNVIHALTFLAGLFAISLNHAYGFGRLHGGLNP